MIFINFKKIKMEISIKKRNHNFFRTNKKKLKSYKKNTK